MTAPLAFQRLTLQAVLRNVSPMIIRVVSVPDDADLTDLHEIFQAILGWNPDLSSCGPQELQTLPMPRAEFEAMISTKPIDCKRIFQRRPLWDVNHCRIMGPIPRH